MADISMALGDYLEALVVLGGTTEVPVRPIDVAKRLGVSKPSVCSAISTLRRKGLADQPYRGGITLSEEGYAVGQSILKRHEVASRFLADVLCLDDDHVRAEANVIKYAIEDDALPRWESFIEEHLSA